MYLFFKTIHNVQPRQALNEEPVLWTGKVPTEQGYFSTRKTRAVECTNYIPILFGLKKKNLSMGNCPKRKEVSGE